MEIRGYSLEQLQVANAIIMPDETIIADGFDFDTAADYFKFIVSQHKNPEELARRLKFPTVKALIDFLFDSIAEGVEMDDLEQQLEDELVYNFGGKPAIEINPETEAADHYLDQERGK